MTIARENIDINMVDSTLEVVRELENAIADMGLVTGEGREEDLLTIAEDTLSELRRFYENLSDEVITASVMTQSNPGMEYQMGIADNIYADQR